MKNAMKEAIDALFERDKYLLEGDVHERTISAQLACYLKPLFSEYDVDVEYNRQGLEPKAVSLSSKCDHIRGEQRIFPDIIVHQRGPKGRNLLVIQVKKETNRDCRECDRAIIRAMIQDFGYTRGLLLELPAGAGAAKRKPHCEWFPQD
jgi:hypothetical protein